MATAAVSMVKDEADVIAGTLLHLADEVDFLLVSDNGSTDGTREILAELADELPLTILDDPEVGYRQSEKMTALASQAAGAGADWIIPFDADELWVWRGRRIRDELASADQIDIFYAELFNHFPSGVDPQGVDPFRTIVWRQPTPGALPKVAIRWVDGCRIHQGNHGVDHPHGRLRENAQQRGGNDPTGGIEIRHFPYRSAEQFVRKARNGAAAYAATDLPAHVGAHWRSYGDILTRHGPEALADVFREHFWHLSPVDHGLIPDPAPYMRWRCVR